MSHHALSPSQFPAWSKCPRYDSGGGSCAATKGSNQHALLEQILNNVETPELGECTDEDVEQVSWAAAKIRTITAECSEIHIEHKLRLIEDFEELCYGTADMIGIGPKLILIDYKSGKERDYMPQMAVYARAAMQTFGRQSCHVFEVYGKLRWVTDYMLTMAETRFVLDIAKRRQDHEAMPQTCEYCDWCKHLDTCNAVKGAVVKVATGYEPTMKIAEWHSSQVTDPWQMGMMLDLADVVESWSKSVKEHAKELALTGVDIPGRRLNRIPVKRIPKGTPAGAVFSASGLTVDEFAECCDVGMTKLREAIAKTIGLKTGSGKKAKDEFHARLGALLEDDEMVRLERARKTKEDEDNGTTE